MSVARVPVPPLRGFSLEIPVRFAECDSYGVVWHGHYALYLESVREALTARFGFTATAALGLGYRVPVTRMEIRYRLPIRADATIRAIARLRAPEVALFVIDYELRDREGRLLASAVTEQVVLNSGGELLVTLPGDLKKMAGEILRFQDGPETLPI